MESKMRKRILVIIGVLLLVCVIVGTSFAWWTNTANQTTTNEIISSCLETRIIDDAEFGAININPAYPLTDEEAKTLVRPYKFTVENKCSTTLNYDLSLEILNSENRLLSEYVAMEFSDLNNGNKVLLNTAPLIDATYKEKNEDGTIKENGEQGIEGRLLDSGTLAGNATRTYQIKLWIDEHVSIDDDAMNKTFKSKIVVNSSLNYTPKLRKTITLDGNLQATYPSKEEADAPIISCNPTVAGVSWDNDAWTLIEPSTVTQDVLCEVAFTSKVS